MAHSKWSKTWIGWIITAKETTTGYLSQEVSFDPTQTVLAEAITASPHLAELEAALQQVEDSLADPMVYGNG